MNGCHNRAPFASATVLETAPGWNYTTGKATPPTRVVIPHRMAKDCQYTLTELGQSDKGCDGCIHKQ